ncbi:hypothetical protein D3C76_543100 [compost metagenome]
MFPGCRCVGAQCGGVFRPRVGIATQCCTAITNRAGPGAYRSASRAGGQGRSTHCGGLLAGCLAKGPERSGMGAGGVGANAHSGRIVFSRLSEGTERHCVFSRRLRSHTHCDTQGSRGNRLGTCSKTEVAGRFGECTQCSGMYASRFGLRAKSSVVDIGSFGGLTYGNGVLRSRLSEGTERHCVFSRRFRSYAHCDTQVSRGNRLGTCSETEIAGRFGECTQCSGMYAGRLGLRAKGSVVDVGSFGGLTYGDGVL